MPGTRRCLIWGEGPARTACLGAATPDRPAPPPVNDVGAPCRAIVAALAVLAALGIALPAHAADGSDPFRDGPGVPPGAPAVDAAQGVPAVTVPLEVPPGRHGLAPALALRYSTLAGEGNAGYGFGLEIGSIERSTRLGPPRFDLTDTFVLRLAGQSWDLVPTDGASTRFRTALYSGVLVERVTPGPYGAGSSYFVARDADGRRYRFGFNAAADDTSQVSDFKWGLDRIEDAEGNVLTVIWTAASSEIYPVRIDYASHPATGLPATNTVEFCWEARGDRPLTASGESVDYRLHEVRSTASRLPARQYLFQYSTPGDTTLGVGLCQPGGAIVSGPGGLPGAPPPPAPVGGRGRPTIASAAASLQALSPAGAPAPAGRQRRGARNAPGARSAPAAGDATSAVGPEAIPAPLPDLPVDVSYLVTIERGDQTGGSLPPIRYVYGRGPLPSWPRSGSAGLVPPVPFLYRDGSVDEDAGVRIVDLNRDGLPDLVQLEGRQLGIDWTTTAAVWINTGSAFVQDPAWSQALLNLVHPTDPSRSAWIVMKRGARDRVENGVRFADVNDDGYPDVVRSALWFGQGLRQEIFLNTGSGFTGDVSASWDLPGEPFTDVHADPSRDVAADRGVRLADVDADGRVDLVVSRAEWGGPVERRVYRHDGRGWRLDPRWILPDEAFVRHVPGGFVLDMGVRFVELNGDGFPDLLVAVDLDGAVRTRAYINSGRPDGATPTWTPTERWGLIGLGDHFTQVSEAGDGASLDHGLRVADVDGDGRTDLVAARQWDGGRTDVILYTPLATGVWSARSFPEFPWLFVVKQAGQAPRDQGVRLFDLDGDGGLDALLAEPEGRDWRPNTTWQGRLLMSSYSNGVGGTITLRYAPAPHGGVVEGGGPAALPFPLAVVSEVDAADGLGHTEATLYSYDGGYFRHAQREFRGFRHVIVTAPGGARTLETFYLQQPSLPEAPLRGAPEEEVARRTGDGAVFRRTTWTYDTSDFLPPLRHLPIRREETLYDWSTTDPHASSYVHRTATSWSYVFDDTVMPDRPLLRRVERREGSADDPADDAILTTDLVSATGAAATGAAGADAWLLERPWHESLADVAGQVVDETWTSYDGRPNGTAGSRGLPTSVERRGGPPGPPGAHGPGDPDNPVSLYAYDPYGNLDAEIDPLGRARRLVRGLTDASRTFPERSIDALGRATDQTFDPRSGLLLSTVDPNGQAVQFEYDGFGRRVAEWGPEDTRDLPTVSYRYEFGAVPGRVTRFARETSGTGERAGTLGCLESDAYYDGLGRLLEITGESPAGRTVTRAVTYDAAGRIATEAEPFGAHPGDALVPPSDAALVTRYDYDPEGRLISTTDPAGRVRLVKRAGWVVSSLDPLGHRRDVERDAFGRVASVREFSGSGGTASPRPAARYAFDAAGRLLSIDDPSGSSTRLSWDLLGRRLSFDDPYLGPWRYRYDLAGRMIEESDPEGRSTTMTYDLLDRPLERDLPGGRRFLWTYDEGGPTANAVGRLTSVSDGAGLRRMSYDALGRVTRVTRALDGADYAIETAYDALGRITARTYPGGVRATFSYDAGGRLQAIEPYVTQIDHDDRGRITRMTYAGGAAADRLWDPATGVLQSVVASAPGGSTFLRLDYSYDADGLPAAAEERSGSGTVLHEDYLFDSRHRLIRTAGPFGTGLYTYDDAGTMILKEGTLLLRDDPLRPQQVTRTGAGDVLSYGPGGAVTRISGPAGTRALSYDDTGRMAVWEDAAREVVVSTDYDAEGLPIRETTVRGGTTSILRMPFPDVQVLDGRITTQIVAGGLLLAVVPPDGPPLFPIVDPIGSVRAVAQGDGRVVSRCEWSAYGASLSGAPDPLTALFSGARVQAGSGLLVMGSRHYDPSLGRFLEPDTVVSALADPEGLNRYSFARGNPLQLTDPAGSNPVFALLFWGALALLDRDTRMDVAGSVGLTAASIFLTGALGPGPAAGLAALRASVPALYAAAATTVILDSRLGQGVVMAYQDLFSDLGLSPHGAAFASRLFTAWLYNSSLQRGFAGLLASGGAVSAGDDIGGRDDLDAALDDRGVALSDLGLHTGDGYATQVPDVASPDGASRSLERFGVLNDASGRFVGVYGVRDLGGSFEHGAVDLVGAPGHAVDAPLAHSHFAYGIGGISTQQVAREIYSAGYSGTLFTLTGRASDFLIEFAYGPYGGGLAFGLGLASGDSRGGP